MSSLNNLLNPESSHELSLRLQTVRSPTSSTTSPTEHPVATIHTVEIRPPPPPPPPRAEVFIRAHDPHPDCPDTLACLPDTDGRPQHTLPVILRCTILGSPRKRLTIREIYAAMERKYPYYKTAGPAWKQSVRHHLSFNRLFERQPRPPSDPGFGSYWTVNLDAPPGTKRPRKRGGRANKTDGSETGTITVLGPSSTPPPPPIQRPLPALPGPPAPGMSPATSSQIPPPPPSATPSNTSTVASAPSNTPSTSSTATSASVSPPALPSQPAQHMPEAFPQAQPSPRNHYDRFSQPTPHMQQHPYSHAQPQPTQHPSAHPPAQPPSHPPSHHSPHAHSQPPSQAHPHQLPPTHSKPPSQNHSLPSPHVHPHSQMHPQALHSPHNQSSPPTPQTSVHPHPQQSPYAHAQPHIPPPPQPSSHPNSAHSAHSHSHPPSHGPPSHGHPHPPSQHSPVTTNGNSSVSTIAKLRPVDSRSFSHGSTMRSRRLYDEDDDDEMDWEEDGNGGPYSDDDYSSSEDMPYQYDPRHHNHSSSSYAGPSHRSYSGSQSQPGRSVLHGAFSAYPSGDHSESTIERLKMEMAGLRRQSQDAVNASLRLSDELQSTREELGRSRQALKLAENLREEEVRRRIQAEKNLEEEARRRRAAEDALRQYQAPRKATGYAARS